MGGKRGKKEGRGKEGRKKDGKAKKIETRPEKGAKGCVTTLYDSISEKVPLSTRSSPRRRTPPAGIETPSAPPSPSVPSSALPEVRMGSKVRGPRVEIELP